MTSRQHTDGANRLARYGFLLVFDSDIRPSVRLSELADRNTKRQTNASNKPLSLYNVYTYATRLKHSNNINNTNVILQLYVKHRHQ